MLPGHEDGALTPPIFFVVPSSRVFTWSGERSGERCRIRAAAPAARADENDVPEPLAYFLPIALLGYAVSIVDPGDRLDTTDWPGASTSGLTRPSVVGPMLEKPASRSSLSETVVLSLLLPTVTMRGSLPGEVIEPGMLFPLPAAATTTIPSFQTRSTAKSSGSTR